MLLNMSLFISKQKSQQWYVDLPLLLPVIALMSIGFIMVSSASFSFGDYRLGDELFFFKRHLAYLAMGLVTLMICFFIPSEFWSKYARFWMLIAIVLLILVLVPGVGREVNGSRRWLSFAGLTLQVLSLIHI